MTKPSKGLGLKDKLTQNSFMSVPGTGREESHSTVPETTLKDTSLMSANQLYLNNSSHMQIKNTSMLHTGSSELLSNPSHENSL